MLHELLVALRGHPGYIFCEKGGSLAVNSSLPFFHPCEVAIINQILLVSVCEGLDPVMDPYRQGYCDKVGE